MRVALSGTPGTGKTSVGEALAARGHIVVEVNQLAKDKGLLGKMDRRRATREVDAAALDKAVSDEEGLKDAILVGHLSHLLTVDLIIILRCRPSILAARLADRGYSEGKVKENVEAEALDVILIEAAETGRLVAAMAEVGSGRAELEDVKRALAGQDVQFGLAPSENLYLMDVRYDFAFNVDIPANLEQRLRDGRQAAFMRLDFFEELRSKGDS